MRRSEKEGGEREMVRGKGTEEEGVKKQRV